MRVGAEGGDTADEEVGVVLTGLTGTLVGDDARHVAGQGGGQVAGRDLQLAGVDGGDGADDALLLLGSEGDHDGVVKGFGLVPKGDGDAVLAGEGELQVFHAYHAGDQDSPYLDSVEDEGTVFIGDGASLASLDHDCGSGKRFAFGVDDMSGQPGGIPGSRLGRSLRLGDYVHLASVDLEGVVLSFEQLLQDSLDVGVLELQGDLACFVHVCRVVEEDVVCRGLEHAEYVSDGFLLHVQSHKVLPRVLGTERVRSGKCHRHQQCGQDKD